MAKIVIAGSAGCPHYAKVELLADNLAKNLPSFKLTKIVKTPEEWRDWSHECCKERGWYRYNSPIVWRELVNQGGKGVLIGGANEFQEYVRAYYNCESDMQSEQQQVVALENAHSKAEADAEAARLRGRSRPLRVAVTAAGGPTAYHLLPLLADGSVFGLETELAFTLFDASESAEMEGLAMEVEDLAQPLVRSVRCTRSFSDALLDADGRGADLLVLLDELPPAAGSHVEAGGQARSDWLRRNARLYRSYAADVEAACLGGPAGIRVLVAGRGPVNFAARVLLERWRSGGPHPDRVAAAARLLERQAKGAVAAKVGVSPAGVGDLVVWGDPAGGHTVELGQATVTGHEGGAITGPDWYRRPLLDVLWDQDWLLTDFPRLVSRRQADSLQCRPEGHFAASSARAVADTLRDWWLGDCGEGITSLGVASGGWYNIPEGVVFSFPVRFQPKVAWSVVQDFELSEDTLQKLQELAEEVQRDYEIGAGSK